MIQKKKIESKFNFGARWKKNNYIFCLKVPTDGSTDIILISGDDVAWQWRPLELVCIYKATSMQCVVNVLFYSLFRYFFSSLSVLPFSCCCWCLLSIYSSFTYYRSLARSLLIRRPPLSLYLCIWQTHFTSLYFILCLYIHHLFVFAWPLLNTFFLFFWRKLLPNFGF